MLKLFIKIIFTVSDFFSFFCKCTLHSNVKVVTKKASIITTILDLIIHFPPVTKNKFCNNYSSGRSILMSNM